MCPFDKDPVKGLSTPIEWMLFVAILIDRPKSVPQMLCNRTFECIKILKLTIIQGVSFLSSNTFST